MLKIQDIVKVLKNHLHDSNLARVAHHCARLLDSLPDIGKVEKWKLKQLKTNKNLQSFLAKLLEL